MARFEERGQEKRVFFPFYPSHDRVRVSHQGLWYTWANTHTSMLIFLTVARLCPAEWRNSKLLTLWLQMPDKAPVPDWTPWCFNQLNWPQLEYQWEERDESGLLELELNEELCGACLVICWLTCLQKRGDVPPDLRGTKRKTSSHSGFRALFTSWRRQSDSSRYFMKETC